MNTVLGLEKNIYSHRVVTDKGITYLKLAKGFNWGDAFFCSDNAANVAFFT